MKLKRTTTQSFYSTKANGQTSEGGGCESVHFNDKYVSMSVVCLRKLLPLLEFVSFGLSMVCFNSIAGFRQSNILLPI